MDQRRSALPILNITGSTKGSYCTLCILANVIALPNPIGSKREWNTEMAETTKLELKRIFYEKLEDFKRKKLLQSEPYVSLGPS